MPEPVVPQSPTDVEGWWLIHVDGHGDAATAHPPVADVDAAMVGAAIILGRAPGTQVHLLSARAGGGCTTLRGVPSPR